MLVPGERIWGPGSHSSVRTRTDALLQSIYFEVAAEDLSADGVCLLAQTSRTNPARRKAPWDLGD